jgi:hypothetical protein
MTASGVPFGESHERRQQVAKFGEELFARLFEADHVAGQSDFPFADLYHPKLLIAFQVKMSNKDNPPRSNIGQVECLYDEVSQGSFLAKHGVYVFGLYRGIGPHPKSGKLHSLVRSRNLDEEARRWIWAKELQRVCVFDVRVVQHLGVNYPGVKERNAMVQDEPHLRRREYTYRFRRRLLQRFADSKEEQIQILRKAVEHQPHSVVNREVSVRFTGRQDIVRKLPISIIGRKDTVDAIDSLVRDRAFSFDVRPKHLVLTPAAA